MGAARPDARSNVAPQASKMSQAFVWTTLPLLP